MNTPWIELTEYQDQENLAGPGFVEYIWQALFACQVGIPTHQEWVKLKWGFNASALFDETLERQRLFLESQHTIQNELGTEDADHRTLAFRYINRPGEGLLVAIIGKIHGRTREEGMEKALAFYLELKATFPYDYILVPALTEDEFIRFSGGDILDEGRDEYDLAQVKRFEVPIHLNQNSSILQGLWQSSPRAHEQIWRSLAASPYPLLLNMAVRCTVLYEKERERLLKCANEISTLKPDGSLNQKTLSMLKKWNNAYTERRLTPWKKFFYLQVHLASIRKIDENLFRIVSTALVLSKEGHAQPGYQVISPKFDEGLTWRKKLRNLDFIFSGSYLPIPRLAEVADLEEVFAVLRLPYSPPENGLPNMNFVSTRADQE